MLGNMPFGDINFFLHVFVNQKATWNQNLTYLTHLWKVIPLCTVVYRYSVSNTRSVLTYFYILNTTDFLQSEPYKTSDPWKKDISWPSESNWLAWNTDFFVSVCVNCLEMQKSKR